MNETMSTNQVKESTLTDTKLATEKVTMNNTNPTAENTQVTPANTINTAENTDNAQEQSSSSHEVLEQRVIINNLAELRKQEDIRIDKATEDKKQPLFFDFDNSLAPSKKLSLSLCNVAQLRARIFATLKHCANGTTTVSVTLGSSVSLMIDGKKSFKAPTGHFSEPQDVVDFIRSNMDSDKLDQLLLAAQNSHILKLNRNKSVKGKEIAKARKEAIALKHKQKRNARLANLDSDTELLSAETAHFKAEIDRASQLTDDKQKNKAA